MERAIASRGYQDATEAHRNPRRLATAQPPRRYEHELQTL